MTELGQTPNLSFFEGSFKRRNIQNLYRLFIYQKAVTNGSPTLNILLGILIGLHSVICNLHLILIVVYLLFQMLLKVFT